MALGFIKELPGQETKEGLGTRLESRAGCLAQGCTRTRSRELRAERARAEDPTMAVPVLCALSTLLLGVLCALATSLDADSRRPRAWEKVRLSRASVSGSCALGRSCAHRVACGSTGMSSPPVALRKTSGFTTTTTNYYFELEPL